MTKPQVLSVVIPCYNEAKSIPLIFEKFQQALAKQAKTGLQFEVILVDNGSRDNSSEVLVEELQKYGHSHFRVHTVKDNKGYGFISRKSPRIPPRT